MVLIMILVLLFSGMLLIASFIIAEAMDGGEDDE